MLGLKGASKEAVTQEFRTAIREAPDFYEAHLALGLVYVQADQGEQAVEEFRKAIQEKPDSAEAHADLGAVLTESDLAEAVKELEGAVKLDPTLTSAHYNLGIAYGRQGNVEQEISELRKVVTMAPQSVDAQYTLGKM